MNPEVGSVMSYFHKLFPVVVYTKEVPINFERPSLYFPTPFTFDGNDTTNTFVKTYNLTVKLFHQDSQLADSKAELIADAVRSNRSVIPIVDTKGVETGDFIRFGRIETRIGDKGVATIIMEWTSRYYFEEPEWNVAEYIEFQSGVKE
ncbi:phage portal protein [Oceanobacillus sp. CF4.6]|uniref:phage portal protein n=1 Tax=Oceanobacillus sp. CF4.6 TaxID=3373080 RepID=UPI003EE80DF4